MNRYWLTMHWPHPVDVSLDHEWFIYLQHDRKALGEQVSPGDGVVFYETARGKSHRRKGTKELVKLTKGRQAVVGLGEVKKTMRQSTTGQNVKEYADGRELNWAWEIPCGGHRWGKEVTFADVTTILGRKKMRIPGGLMEIDKSQYDEFKKRLGL